MSVEQPHALAVQELVGRHDFSQHASAQPERLQQLLEGLAPWKMEVKADKLAHAVGQNEPRPTEPEGSPTQKNHVDRAGFARTQDGHGRDDAQGSFRADEQLLEVVARVVFTQRGQTVQHPAVCQNLDAKHTRSMGQR